MDLIHIVKIQFQKTKQTVISYDADLAFEVINTAKRIQILKMQIDLNCRDFLALNNPVAIDLRLILSAFKTCESLDKIALHSKNICNTLMKINEQIPVVLLDDFEVNKMLDRIVKMLYDIEKAFKTNDPKLAAKTYKKDKSINKVNIKSTQRSINWLEGHPEDLVMVLSLLEIIADVDMVGDLIKNISEGIVFHLESKSIKNLSHQNIG